MRINHQFLNQAFFFPYWKIDTLVLGTFNPECGEIVDYFYGRSRNRFWRAIEIITGNENYYFQNNFGQKERVMSNYRFGCTDIIKYVEIEKYYRDRICGNGYSDSALFTMIHVDITYQFDEIKNYLIANNVKKVINTWGARNNPNVFVQHIDDLENFCLENGISFVRICPSPSPRARNNMNVILNFYRVHLFNLEEI